jgi:hypothetical protein
MQSPIQGKFLEEDDPNEAVDEVFGEMGTTSAPTHTSPSTTFTSPGAAVMGDLGEPIANPLSIDMTQKGASPFIHENPAQPQQIQMGRTDPNTNPWLSRGGPDMKVGDNVGSRVSLEWSLTFDSTPNVGQWGRNIWTSGDGFQVGSDGSVSLVAPAQNDTSPKNDYISGNKVYMYDQPGRLVNVPGIAPATQLVFEVWAQSGDGRRTSKWYYVDPTNAKFYEISPPKPYTPPPAATPATQTTPKTAPEIPYKNGSIYHAQY